MSADRGCVATCLSNGTSCMLGPWQTKMGGGGSCPQTTEGFAGRNRKGNGMGMLQEQRAGEN